MGIRQCVGSTTIANPRSKATAEGTGRRLCSNLLRMTRPRSLKPPLSRAVRFFATAPKGLEPLVAEELKTLGAREVKESRGGASFEGAPADAYRACLWLRTANRVLLPIARF